jgi:asparaginyl-tRNA synthetase
MENAVTVEGIARHVGEKVALKGWLYNKRSSGKIHFLELRDGTGIVQCVMEKASVSGELFDLADSTTQESSIVVEGTVHEDPRSPIGFEVRVTDYRIVSMAMDYPISPKEHGVEFLMDHRHLWLRSRRQHAILRIRAEVIRGIRDYFDGNGFTLIDAPVLTPSACEGTTTLFRTDYFGEEAFLTQSGQLYNEAGAMAFGKVYCFGPTFRAEKSKTRRHLLEFWMVEPEVAYLDLDGDMDLAEDLVCTLVQRVLKNRAREMEVIERDVRNLENVKKPFPRISYDEAVRILDGKGAGIRWGDEFGGDEETILGSAFDRPVMIHRYPLETKAFYMKADPADPRLALCVDMIAPEGYGEIIGGGQREDDLALLEKSVEKHDLPRRAFEWYFDLRRFGSVPHAGFGLGVERTVAWICGLHHVRETIPFPRLLNRLSP